ncbi:ribosome-associated protein [Nitrosomonas eutropha]|uniref:Ribosomal silencing factor RsfS n=1 Tax=Nitrosomonas eutropha TaxID=916 RepID=A0A1I7GKG0_9PROT|nr:ribosome silencing factor [Nitrosomonas eutropha]SFU48923.1 ribosome-associated protein [Nitrosomonas eutropha]
MKLPDEQLETVIMALEDLKASDIRVIDVSKLTPLFNTMVIASADSTRQTKALAGHVQEKVKATGRIVYGMEGEQTGEWMLVDLGDIIVHIMQPAMRSYYDLEGLWAESSWQSPQENATVYG